MSSDNDVVKTRHSYRSYRRCCLEDERWTVLPNRAQERRRTNSGLHASSFLLKKSLCCVHPKEEIRAPAFLDIEDLFCNILLALVLLWEDLLI